MYKLKFNAVVAVAAAVCLGFGCGPLPPLEYYKDIPRVAGPGESEIIVNRLSNYVGSKVEMKFFLDNKNVLSLRDGESAMIVVPNGDHTIYGTQWTVVNSDTMAISASSNRILLVASYSMESWRGRVSLRQYDNTPLNPAK